MVKKKTQKVILYCNCCGNKFTVKTAKDRFCSQKCGTKHFSLLNTWRREYYLYRYHTKIKTNKKLMEKRRIRSRLYQRMRKLNK